MITRRGLLAGSAATAAYAALTKRVRASTGQTWGAIRWDAWWGSGTDAHQGQGNLQPAQWRFRAPSWVTNTGTGLAFNPTQAAMDGEITAANTAGLKYWAYDWYPSVDSDFMTGLNFHRSSSIKTLMNYCLIVQLSSWGGTGNYSTNNAAITAFAGDSYYQKVSTKPVVFILWSASAFTSQWGGSNANVAAAVSDLRSKMVAASLTTPYVVLLTGTADVTTMTAIGADALGTYAIGPSTPGLPLAYTSLDTQVQAFWATQLAASGSPNVVPTCMTGWDIRPINEGPPSWYGTQYPWIGHNNYVSVGTNTQVANHAQAGVNLIGANATQCPQKLGLIYSWDECSEGGNALAASSSLLTAVGAIVA